MKTPSKRLAIFTAFLVAIMYAASSCKPKVEVQPLNLVAIMPMTGVIAYFGEQEYWGLALAVDEINSQGGINGRKIQLVLEDTQGDPKQAVTIAQKHAANAKDTIFFVTTSKASKAVIPIAQKAGIDLVAFCSDPDITEMATNVIRPYMSFATEADVITSFLKEKRWQKIGIIRGDDQAFANEMVFFRQFAKERDITVVAEEVFTFQQRDFRASFLKILEAKPEAIVALGWGFEVPTLLGQYKENPTLSAIPLIGGYTFLTDPAQKGTKDLYDGIHVVTFPRAINNPEIEKLRDRIAAKFGRRPNQFLDYAFAYDYVKMINSGWNNHPKARSSIEAVLLLGNFEGTASMYTIDKDRDAKVPLTIARYSNGLLELVR